MEKYTSIKIYLATVITNLLSAIPVFGQDLVELKSFTDIFSIYLLYNNIIPIRALLPTIGIISPHALKKGKKLRIDKKRYLSIPYPFLAFLAGLIDGDGYIQITKTSKGFITIKLIIGLHLRDISTLEYIVSVLEIGKIQINKDHKSPNCKWIVNKTDLQEILFPLFLHHNIFFLTSTRRSQFDLAMHIFYSNIKLFNLISNLESIPTVFNLPDNPYIYLNLKFYHSWLVGFTVAEGSFIIKKNLDACFQLKQRMDLNLFKSFKLLFSTKTKIYEEENKYHHLVLSSKLDIQKVITFFSFSGHHPLVGLKNIQYLMWLENLKKMSRYKNLNFPH
jgi:hypothetical protein